MPTSVRMGLGDTGVVRDGLPRIRRVSAALTGSGAQAGLVIVVGGHQQAAGGDG